MKSRTLVLAGLSAVALGGLWQLGAAETRKTKTVEIKRATRAEVSHEIHTAGYPLVRHFKGNLTLDRAVEIALRQNPEILIAIQDIERTRGLIVEVRAAALPHLTLAGTYDQSDPRLLEGGGGRGVGGTSTNVSGGSLAGRQLAPENSQPVVNTNTTGITGSTTTTGQTAVPGNASAVRAPRNRTAAAADGSGTGGTGSSTDELAAALQQITDELSRNTGRSIQDKSWAISLEVRQALYTGGQVTSALRIAKFTQDSAYYQLRDTVDRIISQVREQFYLVLLNRALIEVSEEALRLANEQLQDQRNRFEAGTVPRFNVLRAEVEVANVQPNLIRARNDYLLSQIQLGKRIGLDPGPDGRPEFYAVGKLGISDRRLSLVDALALAKARRPFLKVQRQQILIDAEQIKLEMAGYKPRLDASAGYEIRNRNSSDDLSDVVNGWFFGVTGSWDIFDGFRTYGRVKQSRARLEQSKINYDDSVRQVELEVQSAFANLQQARETVASQQKNVEQAEEAVRLAQERFAAGAGTQLEVLDARVALTRARTTELQSRSDLNRGLAELDRATATNTRYDDSFRDPMLKVEKGVFARIAEIGLPKPPEDLDPAKDGPARKR
jgi:outer membrane protein TolC